MMLKTGPLHFITLFLLISFCASAQVESPPTLALGVAGVVGKKGSIDVDLLAQIISEKQGELKQEFIKKTFFNDLENHSYTLWEFSYSTMNVLLESESKDAIKKNVLENAANLALVYGFAELYLQLSRKMCHSALDTLLLAFDSNYRTNQIFQCGPALTLSSAPIKLHELKQYSMEVGGENLNLSSVFVDLIFEVLRNNESVTKSLGFLVAPFPLGQDYYLQHSAYFRANQLTSLQQPLHHLKKRMSNEVGLLLNNFILLKKIVRSELPLDSLVSGYTNVLNEIQRRDAKISSATFSATQTRSLFESLAKKTDSVYNDLQKVQRTVTAAGDEALSSEISENLAAFNTFVAKGSKFDQFDIYYLEQSIMPLLVRLVTEKGFNPKYLQIARDFDNLISYSLLKKLQSDLHAGKDFSDLTKTPLSNFGGILELITRLDELDKVETYQFVLQTIQNVGEMYNDRKLGAYLKTLVDNINTYTILNEKDEQVEIAVEDIITRIYEKFADRQSSIFNLYFSIGLNQSIDSKFKYQRTLPNSTAVETDTIESLAFASEKIGLKIKIIDFKWRRSFSVGETYYDRLTQRPHTVTRFRSNKPLVSDVYFVTYLSGLLYNVANLTTHDEFKDPIAGIGVGVAFFNALDLNIGYNWPLQSNNDFFESFRDQRIWTVGFDIKITEYLTALGKKRKEKVSNR